VSVAEESKSLEVITSSELSQIIQDKFDEAEENFLSISESPKFDFNLNEVYEIAEKVMDYIPKVKEIEYQTIIEKFTSKEVDVLFSDLLNFEFPLSLNLSIPVTSEFFTQCLIEYIKYMILQCLTNYKMVPGFWVDEVWHAHMQNTRNYRDFCSILKHLCCMIFENSKQFMDFIPHQPSDKSEEEESKLEEMYELTKQMYESTFGQQWPHEIWRKEGIRTFQVGFIFYCRSIFSECLLQKNTGKTENHPTLLRR
jgi:hypothetical protein